MVTFVQLFAIITCLSACQLMHQIQFSAGALPQTPLEELHSASLASLSWNLLGLTTKEGEEREKGEDAMGREERGDGTPRVGTPHVQNPTKILTMCI